MAKTFHYHMAEPYTYPEGGTYIMFSFFTFNEGKLNIGQCQSVKSDVMQQEIDALTKNGWTKGSYKYINGKPVLIVD